MKFEITKDNYDWTPLKTKRNTLLQSTDRYLLGDFPCTEDSREKIIVYRQELRVMFDNVQSPEQVVFPPWPLD